ALCDDGLQHKKTNFFKVKKKFLILLFGMTAVIKKSHKFCKVHSMLHFGINCLNTLCDDDRQAKETKIFIFRKILLTLALCNDCTIVIKKRQFSTKSNDH